MAKKYYWLKLKRDFFKRHDIRIIEEMTNGKDYILFYLKLLCESVDHEGRLRFSDEIPYNEKMLATITDTNIDIVRSAITAFSQLGMMEVMDDGTYYMNGVEKLIGVAQQDEHTRESTRLRVQAHRERKKQAQIEVERYSNVTCNGEIEKEIEKDKDKYICAFDEFWKAYPRRKDKARAYKCYLARLNDGYTEEQLLTACKNYAAECKRNKTEERYIKHGATFLSVNEPFLDYLKGEGNDRGIEQDSDGYEEREKEYLEYFKSDEFKSGGQLPFM